MTEGPSPVLTRSSFLANISARINAASEPSPQYPECAYTSGQISFLFSNGKTQLGLTVIISVRASKLSDQLQTRGRNRDAPTYSLIEPSAGKKKSMHPCRLSAMNRRSALSPCSFSGPPGPPPSSNSNMVSSSSPEPPPPPPAPAAFGC